MALVNCPNCGQQVSSSADHCPHCGVSMYTKKCPECGYMNKHDTASCFNCGYQFVKQGNIQALSIISLVLGILSIIMFFVASNFIIAFIFSACSCLYTLIIRKKNYLNSYTKAGMITSIIGMVLPLIVVMFILIILMLGFNALF